MDMSENKQDEELSYQRFKSQYRLKTALERICEKYGRSFEGVSDEIDLVNEKVVVDRGFVRNTPTKVFGESFRSSKVEEEEIRKAWDSPGSKQQFLETGIVNSTVGRIAVQLTQLHSDSIAVEQDPLTNKTVKALQYHHEVVDENQIDQQSNQLNDHVFMDDQLEEYDAQDSLSTNGNYYTETYSPRDRHIVVRNEYRTPLNYSRYYYRQGCHTVHQPLRYATPWPIRYIPLTQPRIVDRVQQPRGPRYARFLPQKRVDYKRNHPYAMKHYARKDQIQGYRVYAKNKPLDSNYYHHETENVPLVLTHHDPEDILDDGIDDITDLNRSNSDDEEPLSSPCQKSLHYQNEPTEKTTTWIDLYQDNDQDSNLNERFVYENIDEQELETDCIDRN